MSNLQIFKLQPLAKAGRSEGQSAEILHTSISDTKKKAKGQSTEAPANQHAIQSRRVHEFCGLISFLSHTAPLYRTEIKELNIPQELFSLFHQNCEGLDPFLRKTLVQALILLQNRGLIRRVELLPALFRTFRCADKELRRSVFQQIVADIQRLHKSHNHAGMVELQKVVFTMLKEDHPGVALKALQVLVELWKRNVWVTEQVVNAVGTMCFSTDDKLCSASLHYFLGNYDTADEDDIQLKKDSVDKHKEISQMSASLKHIKRRMKKTREIERRKKAVKNIDSQLYDDDSDDEDAKKSTLIGGNLNPLSLIYDPQHFAERLFSKLKTSRESFSTRMLIMDVLSKLIGMHKLLVFNFYPFIQRYLQPHQRHVTQLIAFTARATHALVPPEVLAPVIKTLANHFVSDRSPPEVMATGINAIREICARAPLVMTADLLHDLSEYSRHKNKGITVAARSLIDIFRQLNPALLRRKDRGRDASMKLQLQAGKDDLAKQSRELAASKYEYGAEYLHRDIEGMDLFREAGYFEEAQQEDEWDESFDTSLDERLQEVESDDPDSGKLTKKQLRKLVNARGPTRKHLIANYRARGLLIPGIDYNLRRKLGENEDEDEDVREMSLSELLGEGEDGDIHSNLDDLEMDEDMEEDMEGMDMEDMEGMDMEDMEGMDMEDMEMEDMEMEDMEEEEEEEEEEVVTPPKPRPFYRIGKLTTEEQPTTSEQPDQKLGAIRILTPADFKRLEALKQKRILEGSVGLRKRQRELLKEDILATVQYTRDMIDGSYRSLEGEDLRPEFIKKRRQTKEDRLARVQEGRDLIASNRGSTKFGHRVKEDNLGRSNEEKLKDKNFMMVKKSRRVQAKATKSFRDKQKGERKHLTSLRKMSKNLKKNIRKGK